MCPGGYTVERWPTCARAATQLRGGLHTLVVDHAVTVPVGCPDHEVHVFLCHCLTHDVHGGLQFVCTSRRKRRWFDFMKASQLMAKFIKQCIDIYQVNKGVGVI